MIPSLTRFEVVMAALNLDVAKKRGRRAWALCPFHNDHDPTNFFVRISGDYAGTYHCFGCKKGGSIIDLVMKLRNIEYKAAKAFVAAAGKGYEPPKAKVRVVERPPLLGRKRFKLPGECIMNTPLDSWVTLARRYAISRHITQAEIDRYGLGYAVESRLGGRIVFPVLVGADARPESYSARSFVGADRKYLTPHESEDANLDALFGEHLWPADMGEREVICVTEGAINALACARATDFEASSISGSDVRPGHVLKFGTFKTVVLLTDPDKAGDKAARGFRSSLGRRTTVVRVQLPTGKDADDLTPNDLHQRIERFLRAEGAS